LVGQNQHQLAPLLCGENDGAGVILIPVQSFSYYLISFGVQPLEDLGPEK
jgi:hypothetical protein